MKNLSVLVLVFIIHFWISSGNLAPYAINAPSLKQTACGNILNIDESNFRDTFKLLDSQKRQEGGVVYRRMLYPLIAYPFMINFGFYYGGLLATLIIYIGTIFLIHYLCKKHFSKNIAFIANLLFVTYPGIFYWSGQPFSYVLIVPCSILSFLLLLSIKENNTLKKDLFIALCLGFLSTAYDILPFYLTASIFLLIFLRKFFTITPFIILSILPLALVVLVEQKYYKIPFNNSNVGVYANIFNAYFNLEAYQTYLFILKKYPITLWNNFLHSNMTFIPILFLGLFLKNSIFANNQKLNLSIASKALIFSVFLVFSFNNLAPAYEGWQMRGNWIARIYQPIFPAMVFFILKYFHKNFNIRSIASVFLFLTVIANTLIIWSPFADLNYPLQHYYNFYQTKNPNSLKTNLDKFGRTPVKFCKNALLEVKLNKERKNRIKIKRQKRMKRKLKSQH